LSWRYRPSAAIATHSLSAATLIVGEIVLRLHVGNAHRLIAIDGDDMIGDHVLGCLQTADRAARRLGPPVGGDLARPAAKDGRKIHFYFISEARSEAFPIAHIEAGCIPQLAVADLRAIN
jgi:hypothetical protein